VVDEHDLWVHDPHVRAADVRDGGVRARHEPQEDRRLLRDEQRREREPHDDAEVLRPVADQHAPGDEVHDLPFAPALRTRSPRRPARLTVAMWSARRSMTSGPSAMSGWSRSMTARLW